MQSRKNSPGNKYFVASSSTNTNTCGSSTCGSTSTDNWCLLTGQVPLPVSVQQHW